MDEEFRGRWPSHLEQFTSRSANRNSLPSDVRSISEGPPVWLIGSHLRIIYDALYKSTLLHHHHLKELAFVNIKNRWPAVPYIGPFGPDVRTRPTQNRSTVAFYRAACNADAV